MRSHREDGPRANIADVLRERERLSNAPGTVPRVPNKRKPGQVMLTFWLPIEEADAAREAVAALDTTITDECRRALRNAVKRAARGKL